MKPIRDGACMLRLVEMVVCLCAIDAVAAETFNRVYHHLALPRVPNAVVG